MPAPSVPPPTFTPRRRAQPTGPVTFSKAWIEMIHRYLAMTVGALILVVTLASWAARRTLPLSPWWATGTLAWVLMQGLFGALTVTWKLHPIIVMLHLLGGMLLLALLVAQHEGAARPRAALAGRARTLLLGHAGAAGVADRARRLGQQQLRRAGLQRLPAVQWRVVAGHGLSVMASR